MTFIESLDKVEAFKRKKQFDLAWREANKALIELLSAKDDMWFMMYYQMADILAKEKKWMQALEKMGFVIHYLKGLGGITHEKFVKRLLKKVNKEGVFNEYIELARSYSPKEFSEKLNNLLNDLIRSKQ